MLTLIVGVWASEPPPPQAWRTTEKAGPDRVKTGRVYFFDQSGGYSKECNGWLTMNLILFSGLILTSEQFNITSIYPGMISSARNIKNNSNLPR